MNLADSRELGKAFGLAKERLSKYRTEGYQRGADKALETIQQILRELPSFNAIQFEIGEYEARGFTVVKIPGKDVYYAECGTGCGKLICSGKK